MQEAARGVAAFEWQQFNNVQDREDVVMLVSMHNVGPHVVVHGANDETSRALRRCSVLKAWPGTIWAHHPEMPAGPYLCIRTMR